MPEWTFLRMRWDAIFVLMRTRQTSLLVLIQAPIVHSEFNLNAKIKLSLLHTFTTRTMFILLSETCFISFGHSKCCRCSRDYCNHISSRPKLLCSIFGIFVFTQCGIACVFMQTSNKNISIQFHMASSNDAYGQF